MKKRFTESFVAHLLALAIAWALVHSVYISFIRPNATAILEERKERLARDEAFVAERSIFVTLRDYEQETCLILMLWAFAIMGFKVWNNTQERNMLKQNVLAISDGTSLFPEDARSYMRPLQALDDDQRDRLLARTLLVALRRFESTKDVQNVANSVKSACDSENDRLDSELSVIRYIAWAIPSIGFIGTVRGIGEALSQAYLAVQGDIAGVTESLGIAFNSTFVALVISIIVMLCVHQLQRVQEQLVIDSQTWCDENLIRHMQVH
ncbi:MAG: MotA/TolQ/ExbB proton channel family protein [Gammaproteobacteria bacterium]|nr:MotA/TolQ/ExbB proton channel family protein [Gammaproteobacteria bacterium]